MNGQPISGWGKPTGSTLFHYFADLNGGVMLESVCAVYFGKERAWFWTRGMPFVSGRENSEDGNCLGCRAWLALPSNRQRLEVQSCT